MALIVIDASCLVDLLLYNTTFADIKASIGGNRLAAPHLIDAEVGQVIRRLLRLGTISQTEANTAIFDLTNMRLQRYPHTFMLADAFLRRNNMTFYDAMYLCLAEKIECPLLTRDQVFTTVSSSVKVIQI